MQIIVTDLTRFRKDTVCIAGIDIKSGICIRPLPYLNIDYCKKNSIRPGSILSGNFSIKSDAKKPHIEDANCTDQIINLRQSTGDQFKSILEKSLSQSISEGFSFDFSKTKKYIPENVETNCSIITIKLEPSSIDIKEDIYESGKLKLNITDDNNNFKYLPINDLGFCNYAMTHQSKDELYKLQDFILSQKEIFLRIGLPRIYNPEGRGNGYWLQVNGIYTFPEYKLDIRNYEE